MATVAPGDTIERRGEAGPAGQAARAEDVLERFWTEASAVVLRAGFFACEPDWTLRQRVFPHYHLWLITAGRAGLTIGEERFDVGSGDALLVPPRVPSRGTHDPRDPLRCYTLHCQVRVLGAVVPDALAALPAVLHPRPEAWGAIVAEADAICRELAARERGYALLANGSMTRIVGALWRAAAEQGAPDAGGHAPHAVPPRLDEVLAYIVAHFREPMTLQDLARVAHLSPAHLSRMFRHAMGVSPFQYLHRSRMRRAKELLAEGDASVAAIAAAVGFADPLYFSRAFKRAEGVSPRHYRQALRSPALP